MKNLGLKVWSVAIAITLAAFVHGQRNRSVMSLIIPIELRNIPASKVVLLPASPQAQVTVRGPSYILSELPKNPLSLSVQLPSEVGNRFLTPLHAGMLGLSPSVEVVSIEPTEVEFVLDTIVEKELKVEVPQIGAMQEDYRLVDIQVKPELIKIRGPKTEVDELKTLETQQLDLREFHTTEEKILPIKPLGRFTQYDPKTVAVTVEVATISREKKFNAVPINILGDEFGVFRALPNKVNIEVTGPRAVIRSLALDNIKAFVQIPKDAVNNANITDLAVQVELPKEISLLYISREKITLERR